MNTQEYTDTLENIKSYCAYQERCESEVLMKLKNSFLNPEEKEKLVGELKEFNFLNNERFAEAYVSGKFKIKGWGNHKIKVGLKAKQLSEDIIISALNNLNSEEYKSRLHQIAEKKWRLLGSKKDRNTQQKLFRFLYGKGYESELINSTINALKH